MDHRVNTMFIRQLKHATVTRNEIIAPPRSRMSPPTRQIRTDMTVGKMENPNGHHEYSLGITARMQA